MRGATVRDTVESRVGPPRATTLGAGRARLEGNRVMRLDLDLTLQRPDRHQALST
jgi:hypothetical protein